MERKVVRVVINDFCPKRRCYLGRIATGTGFKPRLFWPNADFSFIHCRPFKHISIWTEVNMRLQVCVSVFQQALLSECWFLWTQTLTHDVKKAEARVVEGLSPSCKHAESITVADTRNWDVRRLTKTNYHKFHEEPCSAIMQGTRETPRSGEELKRDGGKS